MRVFLNLFAGAPSTTMTDRGGHPGSQRSEYAGPPDLRWSRVRRMHTLLTYDASGTLPPPNGTQFRKGNPIDTGLHARHIPSGRETMTHIRRVVGVRDDLKRIPPHQATAAAQGVQADAKAPARDEPRGTRFHDPPGVDTEDTTRNGDRQRLALPILDRCGERAPRRADMYRL